jgi:hypothetical protein
MLYRTIETWYKLIIMMKGCLLLIFKVIGQTEVKISVKIFSVWKWCDSANVGDRHCQLMISCRSWIIRKFSDFDSSFSLSFHSLRDNYRHGVRFIENRHEIDEKVVESSQIGDACRLKNYRWVNKYAMSRQRQLKHTPWHRQSSVNNCLHVGAKNAFHNFPYLL